MNLFNAAFTKLLTEKDNREFANVCRIAIRSTLKVKTVPYQCFTITPELAAEQNFKPVTVPENSMTPSLEHLRDMMQTALEESLTSNGITYTVAKAVISCGVNRMPGYNRENFIPMAIVEVCVMNGEEIVCWNRCIEELREEDNKTQHPKLEWDRVSFPTPDTVNDDEPVRLLGATDLALISTGNETIRDFAKEAIDAGWSSVSIRGTQLLLIK
ncbi:hypothetical protein pEaSNUABM42_00187 [Erwinia phage pEa_SNUABM_42]|nr:hypothetical protein pEaSNUABM43_00188 [Erwinia phage pEa_SNUABM_43]QVW55504.1 hypothetical protein pEaSNUABM42_00187 [Erwinia phage pEa_SNUABM_42]